MTEIKEYNDYMTISELARETTPLYRKKSWVPAWLWRLVAEPDVLSHAGHSLKEAFNTCLRDLEDACKEG